MHIYKYISLHIQLYAYVYLYICIFIYTYIYIYIYMLLHINILLCASFLLHVMRNIRHITYVPAHQKTSAATAASVCPALVLSNIIFDW